MKFTRYIILCLCVWAWQSVVAKDIAPQYTLSFDGETKIEARNNNGQSDLYISYKQSSATWSQPERLPDVINTAADELWPSLSSDEQELYFVRVHKADPADKKAVDRTMIMCATKQNGVWQTPQNIIISTGEDLSPWIMPDGHTLWLASKRQRPNDKNSTYAIYYTRKAGSYDWYTPKPIFVPVEKNINLYGFRTSERVETLPYQFVQQTCSKKDTTYTMQYAVEPKDCMPLPVMTVVGKAVEISSGRIIDASVTILDARTQQVLTELKCHRGQYKVALPQGKQYILDITAPGCSHHYREYDVQTLAKDTLVTANVEITKQLDIRLYTFDGILQTPLRVEKVEAEGLKAQIRSEAVDLVMPIGQAYRVVLHKHGFVPDTLCFDTRKPVLLTSSELDVELQPCTAPLVVHVWRADTLALIDTEIETTLETDNMQVTSRQAADTLSLRQGLTYRLHVDATGYLYYDSVLTVPYNGDTIVVDLRLQGLQEAMVMQLKNIQFAYNSADLLPSSFAELDKVVQLLRHNPQLRIELAAHTDDQGTDAYNLLLSQRRAESTRRYLLSHEIAPERLEAVGYGKRKPLVPNTNDANRAKNRRVEFKIIGL